MSKDLYRVGIVVALTIASVGLIVFLSMHPRRTDESLKRLSTVTLTLDNYNVGESTVVYAVPARISLSGDFHFYRTERNGQRLDGDSWFFATPDNLEDKANIDRIYNLLSEHPDDVYKITGTREEYNCDYYKTGPCILSISLDQITRNMVRETF